MKKLLISFLLLFCLLNAGVVFAEGNQEESFPTRQIQVIFPWGPSPTLTVSQVIGEQLGKELGQNVVVTSTTGAAGVKAAMTVLSKPADGYTIFDGYVAPLIMAPLKGNTQDYTYKDFTPLFGATSNAFALVCRKDEDRWDDLPGLIDYMQKHPGELIYSGGNDTSARNLVAVSLFKASNVVARKVTFQDNSEVKEFLSGEIDLLVASGGAYAANKGNIRVLAVLSDEPSVEGSGIPGPIPKDYGISLGVEGLAAVGWDWWVVRKDTPEDVVAILRDAMEKVMYNEEVKAKVASLGFRFLDPVKYGPEMYEKVCEGVIEDQRNALAAIDWLNNELANLEE